LAGRKFEDERIRIFTGDQYRFFVRCDEKSGTELDVVGKGI